MLTLEHALDITTVRFVVSGSLITLYMLAEVVARRRPRAWAAVAPPRWVHPVVAASLLAFYALIAPTGGPLLAGFGNLVGGALVLLAATLRFSSRVRYPDLAGRCLLYVALPLAVGVPWGWLALSLPAIVTSVICARRADRQLAGVGRAAPGQLPAYRVIPGVW